MTAPLGVLTTIDLKQITQLEKTGDIARCLRQQGVKFFHGKKGVIWTTMELINRAGGITTPDQSGDTYDAESLIG